MNPLVTQALPVRTHGANRPRAQEGTMTEELDGAQPIVEEVATPEPQDVTEAPEASPDLVESPDGSGEMIPKSRFNEVYAKWKDTERELEIEKAMRQTIEAQPVAIPEPQPAPEVGQFQTYEEYYAALAKHQAQEVLREQEVTKAQAQQDQARASKAQNFQTKGRDFASEHPDYFQKVSAIPTEWMPQDVADVITESDNGPAIAYHLGNNPHEAFRISQLPPHMRAAEIGRMSATLTPPTKKPTQAPPPITPVKGSDTPVKDWRDDPNISNEEWARRRNEELYPKGRR